MRIKRFFALFLLVASLLFVTSCKDVRAGWCELWLVFPHSYEKIETDGSFDAAYSDGEAVVGITRMSFEAAIDDGIPTTLTPLRFAEEYKSRVGLDDYTVKERGDVPYLVYYTREDDGIYTHLASFYKSYYAYFAVTFVCKSDVEDSYLEDFYEIMDSAYLDYGE